MNWAQLLFSQGFGTRRECAALLGAGRVSHAGRTIDDATEVVETAGLDFEVNGQSWTYHEKALVLLHKPAGYECSLKPRHHPSVLSLLPMPLRTRAVQPVGRLDEDTTGLLLLTDDGALIHRLTSPRHHVPKVYEVRCRHPLNATQLDRLRHGVVLDDDPAPVRAEGVLQVDETLLRMTLTQGKYHQVKRMIAAVGNRAEALHRSAFGRLTLDGLATPGQWRWIDVAERDTALAPERPA